MISADKIRAGINRYANEDFINKMPGWRGFALGAALDMLLLKVPDTDIEPIFQALRVRIDKYPEGVTLNADDMKSIHPTYGAMVSSLIEQVTFRRNDIDKIYRYIKEA